jgi:hypothetical protein
MRWSETLRESAKVQTAYGLCKGAKVEYILRSQVSGLGSLVRVIRYRCGYGKIQFLNLYPNLNT